MRALSKDWLDVYAPWTGRRLLYGNQESKINTCVLSTIGNTPVVRLSRVMKDAQFHLYAKLESFNPGGSIKDRAAISIISNAMESGQLEPGSTVIESSSGNMGIGLAQACAYFGFRFVCVIDPKATIKNIEVLRAYGAKIDLVSQPDPATGQFLQARINRVKMLLEVTPDSFWPDQYSNIYNAIAHRQTMHEIVTQMDGKIDYLFCAASTCGTLTGCGEYVRENNLPIKIVAVDAIGSVIFGGKHAKRLIPGHGAAVRPKLYRPDLVDQYVKVSDLDCVIGCRRLIKEEAILAGGSSGGVLMAIERLKGELPEDSVVVAIFADRGERYLDTIYSDEWVTRHFGDVSCVLQHEVQEEVLPTVTK